MALILGLDRVVLHFISHCAYAYPIIGYTAAALFVVGVVVEPWIRSDSLRGAVTQ